MHFDKKYKKSKVTAPPQESASHIPPKVLKNILDFLSPTDGLKTVTITKATLTYFGSYIVQRLQNEKFKYKIIQSYFDHNLALYQDGSLYSWGDNHYGQLGLGHRQHQNTPQLIDPSHFHNKTINSIHQGPIHTLALMEDGSLYTWGYNVYGELGLGHNTNQNTPQLISPDHFENKIIQSIHTGSHHTLVLMTNGSLYAYGQNAKGQLGLGHNNNQNTPQLISPTHFPNKTIQSIHTGYGNTLALMEDGSLYSWGYNKAGELGLGHTDNQYTPQLINPEHFHYNTIKSIHIEFMHALALMDDGTLYTWGQNDYGQLGLDHNYDAYTPQLIDPNHFDNKTIQSIYTEENHTLAMMTDGSLYSWGENEFGQLGLGHTDDQNTPQKIEGRLEKAFRLGHKNLKSLSMFSDKSLEERINLKHQLLSLHVPMADDMEEIAKDYAQGSPSAGQT